MYRQIKMMNINVVYWVNCVRVSKNKVLMWLGIVVFQLSGCQTRPSTSKKMWVLLNTNPNGPNDMILKGFVEGITFHAQTIKYCQFDNKMWSLWHAHFDMVLVGFLSCMLKRTTFPSRLGIGLCKLQYAYKKLHNTYFNLEKSSKTRSCAKELILEPYTRVVCACKCAYFMGCACGKLITSKLWTT